MQILRNEAELAPYAGCALVPTMGALHAGHASLISQAARSGLRAVATVFVNPTQFGPNDDFQKYPRTLEADVEVARAAGAVAVFVPPLECIYPQGAEAAAHEAAVWPVPAVGRLPGLEDACRPGHFGGVCQVVARLWDVCRPALSIFGQKDYQQLCVLTELARMNPARWPSLRIESGETVREPNGLAMSSRNRYMRPEQIEQALGLSRALKLAQALARTADEPHAAELAMREELMRHGLRVEYAVIRDADTLMPIEGLFRPARALIAARLDTVRLIDNAPITPTQAAHSGVSHT